MEDFLFPSYPSSRTSALLKPIDGNSCARAGSRIGCRLETECESEPIREFYEADRLVITAGAWAAKMVPSLGRLAVPERQVLGWFQPSHPDLFAPKRLPVFNMLVEEGRYYGLPIFDVPGFKVGRIYHHLSERIDPDHPDFECHPADERLLRDFVSRYFPDAAGPTNRYSARSPSTNSPDERFLLDVLLASEIPQVAIAPPCSGP